MISFGVIRFNQSIKPALSVFAIKYDLYNNFKPFLNKIFSCFLSKIKSK